MLEEVFTEHAGGGFESEEALCALAAGVAHALAGFGGGAEVGDGGCECGFIRGFDKEAGLLVRDHFWDAGDGGGDDGKVAGHGLGDDGGEDV